MSSTAYAPIQKSLHWAIFLLVVGLYGMTYAEDLFPRGDPGRAMLWFLHISFGLLLLGLVVARVAARVALGAPALPRTTSGLERGLAHLTHFLLYALLFAIPIVGVVLTWMRGDALDFFGLFTIPAPFAPDRETARSVKEVHEVLATLILFVTGVHAAAALWHHYVRRDDVLRRMLPGRAG